MNAVADTSWLVAHVNADDEFHAQAREESKAAKTVHIPAGIWVEFLNVMQYRFGGHTRAAKASDEIRASRNVTIDERLDEDAASRVWRKHPALTYADAIAVAEAKRLGVHLLTFERAQREALNAEG